MINNPQIGMKVEVLPSLVKGMSAGKWAALGRARQGRVIYISGNRWALIARRSFCRIWGRCNVE